MENKQNVKTIKNQIWQARTLVRDVLLNDQILEMVIAFTILRRIDSMIAPFAESCMIVYSDNKDKLSDERLDARLCEITGVPFYNTSGYSFVDITVFSIFTINSYLQGFSKNVIEILDGLNLNQHLAVLKRQERKFMDFSSIFAKLDLSPTSLDNEEFLELISSLLAEGTRRAGINYTSLELSHLISECLLAKDIRDNKGITTIYDPVCGTGSMLAITGEKAKSLSGQLSNISLYGQEISMFPCAIAKALALLTGNEFSQVKYGNTLTEDSFPSEHFQYILAELPYGLSWTTIKDRIGHESYTSSGRFHIGLPKISESQFLFIEHILSKMDSKGSRAAFLTSSYVLTDGSAKSGESRIRRWLFENDLVETIIALPAGSLVYSGIPVYLWILSNSKSHTQKGMVRLIDASSLTGKNHFKVLDSDIVKSIVSEYKSEVCSAMSQIVNNNDFGYYEVNLLRGNSLKANTETVKISLDTDIKEFVEKERQPYTKLLIDIDYSSVEKGYEVVFSKFFNENDAKIDSLAESSINLMSIIDEFNALNSDLKHFVGQTRNNTISASWRELPLHAAIKAVTGLSKPTEIDEINGLPLISVSSLRGNAKEEIRYAVTTRTRCSSTKDAVIIAVGANSGEVFRGVDGILPSTLAVIKCSDMGIIAPEYLYYLLKGYEKSIQLLTRGAAIKSLNIKQLLEFKCLIPPIEEQLNIAEYLDVIVGKLDRIIASLNSTDNTISTYRQILIENIVRGYWRIPTDLSYKTSDNMGLNDNKDTIVVDGVEYVDLGLPSGTKWSSGIYVLQDEESNSCFSYEDALKYNIPTVDQFKELIEYCKIIPRNYTRKLETKIDFVGLNGKTVTFNGDFFEKGNNEIFLDGKYRFWLKGVAQSEKNGPCAYDQKVVGMYKGYKLPIMLVR